MIISVNIIEHVYLRINFRLILIKNPSVSYYKKT